MSVEISDTDRAKVLGIVRDTHDMLSSKAWLPSEFPRVHNALAWLASLETALLASMNAGAEGNAQERSGLAQETGANA